MQNFQTNVQKINTQRSINLQCSIKMEYLIAVLVYTRLYDWKFSTVFICGRYFALLICLRVMNLQPLFKFCLYSFRENRKENLKDKWAETGDTRLNYLVNHELPCGKERWQSAHSTYRLFMCYKLLPHKSKIITVKYVETIGFM